MEAYTVQYQKDFPRLENLLKSIERPGGFCTYGRVSKPMPKVEVEGVGVLGEQIACLDSISNENQNQLNLAFWKSMFDMSLAFSGKNWSMTEGLVEIARFGHFTDSKLAWEQLHFDR